MNFLTTRGLSTVVINSVARTFLSEIADFGPIYRQIRQVFGSKSRKIRQFIAPFSVIFTPAIGQIALHLPTTQKISSFIAFLCINIFKNGIFSSKKKTKLKIYISKNILHFLGFKNCDFVEAISRCSRLIGTRWLFLLLCLVKRSAKLTLYFGFCPIISIFRRNRQVLQKFANIASLGLKIADFRRLAIYRQAQILIASSMSKIADLAIYRQKWQH